jgi:hypothetical protein
MAAKAKMPLLITRNSPISALSSGSATGRKARKPDLKKGLTGAPVADDTFLHALIVLGDGSSTIMPLK